MSIYPVPTTRVTSLLIHERMVAQLQQGQRQLLRVQQQLSTGQRLAVPSDDPAAAVRGISLQRTLEQKSQMRSNLQATDAYLSATDTALNHVSQLLIDARGLAVGAADSTASETERLAMAEQIRGIVRQMMDVGNEKFRGRYLFAGSTTTELPFDDVAGNVEYRGNEGRLKTLADFDYLVDTNVHGHEIFGGFSADVVSQVDLNPVLRTATSLEDLRGGDGVRLGSVRISDGSSSRVVDLSTASTIGDVARLLATGAPTGRDLQVQVTATGLELQLDAGGGGNLVVTEVDGDSTAEQLGILNPQGVGTQRLVGQDLDPILRLTSSLEDVLGARAQAVLWSSGDNNNIVLEANRRGADLNDIPIQLVDDSLPQAAPGLNPGNEYAVYAATDVAARASLAFSGADNDLVLTAVTPGTDLNQVDIELVAAPLGGNAASASYDAPAQRLTITIDDADQTTLGTVVAAIDGTGVFTAAGDASFQEGFNPAGTISSLDAGLVRGNTGNTGGVAGTIFVHVNPHQSTAANVVGALNSLTEFAQDFTASLDPTDSITPALAGSGFVDATLATETTGGSGGEFDQSSGLIIQQGDASTVVRFEDALTVEDLLNRLNESGASVLADLAPGSGRLRLRSRLSGADFSLGENGGSTAADLGLRSFTSETLLSDLNHARGVATVDGTDFSITRNDGTVLNIDLTGATTLGDVLNRINQHPDNLGPTTAVVARLAATGNGIELVDDNPLGTGVLTVTRQPPSFAAWDLGLVPQNTQQAVPGWGAPPVPASAAVVFSPPDDLNSALTLTATQLGTGFNGVDVQFVNAVATGNQALISYDPVAKTLTIDVDPNATTANTVVAAIDAEGTFDGELDLSTDTTNNGTGLVRQTGVLATTAGGTSSPSAQPAIAPLRFPPPNDVDTAVLITATLPGTAFNDVQVELRDTQTGDVATATYDALAQRLYLDIDASLTTANTLVSAITTEGTFSAALDLSGDPTNDGTGAIGTTGVVATTYGGTAEVLTGEDIHPLEVEGVFNTLLRLERGLRQGDLGELSRAVALLDIDLDRVNFGRGAVGARAQGVDILQERIEDEEVALRETLSLEIEVDMAAAISDLATRQASYQAALQMVAENFRVSLLDFL